jgi:predicted nucleic acid-binding protein
MSFLLDSDTCSAHLKSGALTHRIIQYSGRLHISVVTLAELYAWALRRKAPHVECTR